MRSLSSPALMAAALTLSTSASAFTMDKFNCRLAVSDSTGMIRSTEANVFGVREVYQPGGQDDAWIDGVEGTEGRLQLQLDQEPDAAAVGFRSELTLFYRHAVRVDERYNMRRAAQETCLYGTIMVRSSGEEADTAIESASTFCPAQRPGGVYDPTLAWRPVNVGHQGVPSFASGDLFPARIELDLEHGVVSLEASCRYLGTLY